MKTEGYHNKRLEKKRAGSRAPGRNHDAAIPDGIKSFGSNLREALKRKGLHGARPPGRGQKLTAPLIEHEERIIAGELDDQL